LAVKSWAIALFFCVRDPIVYQLPPAEGGVVWVTDQYIRCKVDPLAVSALANQEKTECRFDKKLRWQTL